MLAADSSMAAGAGGCFPGHATVRLSTGQTKTMENLTVGDGVLTYDVLNQQFYYDPVITFLHRSRSTDHTTWYLTVETEYGHRLTLSAGPFLYSLRDAHTVESFNFYSSSVLYMADWRRHDIVLLIRGGILIPPTAPSHGADVVVVQPVSAN